MAELSFTDPGKVILIEKPLEWTSFDVVKKIRGALRIKKIGHAGTLDPLATGLLILCTGKKTKQIASIQEMEKEYEGTFVLGATTPSYDLETEVEHRTDTGHLKDEQIQEASNQFLGEIDQVPPAYSAIKIKGKRAYDKARAGETIVLKSRPVKIYDFDITSITLPEVRFKVRCSKGTYIRSLARDFGEYLGTGAYLKTLKRTRIGKYSLGDAYTIEEFIEKYGNS